MDIATEKSGSNPVLWVVFGILAFTMVASFFLIYVAIRGADPQMPAYYPREGASLDADLQRATAAREIGARVTLDFATPGLVRVRLRFTDAAHPAPASLLLRLTHATLPDLDRTIALRADATGSGFVHRIEPLAAGHWLVDVAEGNHWRVRGQFTAPATSLVELGH
jgi:hypothetical protein